MLLYCVCRSCPEFCAATDYRKHSVVLHLEDGVFLFLIFPRSFLLFSAKYTTAFCLLCSTQAGKLPALSSRTDKGCNPLFVCVRSFFNVVLLWFRLVFFFASAVEVVAFVRVLEELWILNLFVCCRNACFIVDEDDAVVRIEVLCVLSVSRYLRIVVDDVEAFKKLVAQTSEWVSEFSGCFVSLLSAVSCNTVFHFAFPPMGATPLSVDLEIWLRK